MCSSITRFEELERRKDFMRDEVKLSSGWPTSSTPPSAHVTAPSYGGPFELQLAELHRLYSAAAAGAGLLPPLPPGLCHPQNMAAELLQRERLEQLGKMCFSFIVYIVCALRAFVVEATGTC